MRRHSDIHRLCSGIGVCIRECHVCSRFIHWWKETTVLPQIHIDHTDQVLLRDVKYYPNFTRSGVGGVFLSLCRLLLSVLVTCGGMHMMLHDSSADLLYCVAFSSVVIYSWPHLKMWPFFSRVDIVLFCNFHFFFFVKLNYSVILNLNSYSNFLNI